MEIYTSASISYILRLLFDYFLSILLLFILLLLFFGGVIGVVVKEAFVFFFLSCESTDIHTNEKVVYSPFTVMGNH